MMDGMPALDSLTNSEREFCITWLHTAWRGHIHGGWVSYLQDNYYGYSFNGLGKRLYDYGYAMCRAFIEAE